MYVNRGCTRHVRVGIAVPIAVLGLSVALALIERPVTGAAAEQAPAVRGGFLTMTAAEYEDRIRAAWYGQIAGTLMGFVFEHRAAAASFVDKIPDNFKGMPVDDDWYYEMVAVRAFEQWQTVDVDLKAFAGQAVTIRLIQRVLLGPELAPGNAYWRSLRLDGLRP